MHRVVMRTPLSCTSCRYSRQQGLAHALGPAEHGKSLQSARMWHRGGARRQAHAQAHTRGHRYTRATTSACIRVAAPCILLGGTPGHGWAACFRMMMGVTGAWLTQACTTRPASACRCLSTPACATRHPAGACPHHWVPPDRHTGYGTGYGWDRVWDRLDTHCQQLLPRLPCPPA